MSQQQAQQRPDDIVIMVAYERANLYEMLAKAFSRNGSGLVLREMLTHGLVLSKSVYGGVGKPVIINKANNNTSIVRLPPPFKDPILGFLKKMGIVFKDITAEAA